MKKRILASLLIGFLIFAFAFQVFTYFRHVIERERSAVAQTLHGMDRATSQFGNRLSELMQITEHLASAISEDQLDSAALMDHLKQVMEVNPDIFGFGVGYEPYAFSDKHRLFAPFFIRPKGDVELQFVDDSYDYTTRDWYTRPLNEGKAWFEPPYYGEVAQTTMAEYSVPFFETDDQGNRKAIGIVYLDYSLKDISRAVNALDLGKSGYGFMFSEGGIMVAHPVASNILAQKTLEEFSDEWRSEKIKHLFKDLSYDGKPYISVVNPENNVSSRLFFREIEESGWRLGAVFIEDAFKTDSEYTNRFILRLSLNLVLIVIIAVYLYLEKGNFAIRRIGNATPYLAGAFLLGLLVIWISKRQEQFNIYQQEGSYPVTEKTTLERMVNTQDSIYNHYHLPVPVKIPTGIYIKHIDFHKTHEIKLSGIVWQQYPADTSQINPGIFFIDTSPDAEALDMERIYTHTDAEGITVGWYFRVEIRKDMSYLQYPFDQEVVRLSLQHPDKGKGVQLIPDLMSYTDIITTHLPGLTDDLILPEWKPVSAYFDFVKERFNTNFGVSHMVSNEHIYNLGYNVVLKRNFFWPFMSNFIPLITITILLFLALLTLIRNKNLQNGILFNGFGVIELCSAFLFVAILTHIDLRRNLVVNYTIYMDYFYFHIYFVIIQCSFYSVMFNRYKNEWQFRYGILFYWPMLIGSLYLFTLLLFY